MHSTDSGWRERGGGVGEMGWKRLSWVGVSGW